METKSSPGNESLWWHAGTSLSCFWQEPQGLGTHFQKKGFFHIFWTTLIYRTFFLYWSEIVSCRFYLHGYSFLLFFVGSSSFTKPINFGVSWKSIYFSYITHCPWTTCGFRVHLHSDEYISSPAFYAELQVMSTWLPHSHLIFSLFQTYFTLP